MTTVAFSTVGEKNGVPRVWLEGIKLLAGGFKKTAQYEVKEQTKDRLVLVLSKTGDKKVSGRKRNGRDMPIIEQNRADLSKLFEVGQKIRAVIRGGKIIIRVHVVAQKVRNRVERFLSKLSKGEQLASGSLFHGGGILDKAFHAGLHKAGVNSFVKVAVELEQAYLDYSRDFNRELFSGETIFVEGKVEDVSLADAPKLEILIGGIPCTGSSSSGKARNRIQFAEEHSKAGGLFYDYLRFVEETEPAICVIENVPNYAREASMSAIRSVLSRLGYSLQERILEGNEFGALEARKRLCVVAISNGLEDIFDLDAVTGDHEKPATLEAIMDPIPDDSDLWAEMAYLAAKEEEDTKSGKGFRRQLFTKDSAKISTLTREPMKRRSTDPMFQHPTNPKLCRIPTTREHCLAKDIPESMVEDRPGLPSRTILHQIFGQSVVFSCFERVAYHLGAALKEFVGHRDLMNAAGYFAQRSTYDPIAA